MKHFLFCSLILVGLVVPQMQGQTDIYKTSLSRDGAIIGLGAATMTGSLVLQRNHPKLTPADIERLDPNTISGFDRWVTKNWDPRAHQISNGILFSSYALPFAFLLDKSGKDNFGKLGLMSLEGLLLNNGIGNLTKHISKRVRPYVYNPSVPLAPKLSANSNLSFFSGHTSNVAFMYFFTAQAHQDLYPGSSAQPYIWTAAALVPAVQGLLRVKAGKHFLSDVIAGYAVGALVGILVPAIHR
ncbi:MAG: phosphatase PAP2 family protein [Saprospiraceae bacterium]|nr:phosphatase PAP2 family protein [Saprospiraceae bacterium]